MTLQDAEDRGFLAAWDGKTEPDDAAEWPADLLAAWQRGAQQYHAWE